MLKIWFKDCLIIAKESDAGGTYRFSVSKRVINIDSFGRRVYSTLGLSHIYPINPLNKDTSYDRSPTWHLILEGQENFIASICSDELEAFEGTLRLIKDAINFLDNQEKEDGCIMARGKAYNSASTPKQYLYPLSPQPCPDPAHFPLLLNISLSLGQTYHHSCPSCGGVTIVKGPDFR